MRNRTGHRVLRTIAIFKLAKSAALLVVAAGAFEIARDGALASLAGRLHRLPLAEGHVGLSRMIDLLVEMTPRGIDVAGAVACAYAALFAVEGYGLWRERRWAEYLTVGATASLIPFELWALAGRLTVLRGIALIANVAIVICMLMLIRRQRASDRGSAP